MEYENMTTIYGVYQGSWGADVDDLKFLFFETEEEADQYYENHYCSKPRKCIRSLREADILIEQTKKYLEFDYNEGA